MLADHYSRSQNAEKACKYLKLSGDKATKNYSNWEALRFYKDAIEVLAGQPETEESKRRQMEVRLLMACSMLPLGFPEGSLENLQDGERLSKELGDQKNHANFMSLTGQYYAWKGEDLFQAIRYSEDSFKKSEKMDDVELMAPIGGDLCLLYWWAGECLKVIEVAPKVIDLLEKTQKQSEFFGRPYNVYSTIHALYAESMGMLGFFEEAKFLLIKGLDFALKIQDLFSLAVLESHNGTVRIFGGDAKNAIEHSKKSIAYCEEGQFSSLLGIPWLNIGWSYCLLGELKKARECTERGLQIYSEAGVRYDLGVFYAVLGLINLESGDLENARRHAGEALKMSQKIHQKWLEGFVMIILGRIHGKEKESHTNKAQKCFTQGIEILTELKLKALFSPGYHYLGELYADTGKHNKAL